MPFLKMLITKFLTPGWLILVLSYIAVTFAAASEAPPYTLTAGDRVQINHAGLDSSEEAVVDLDGNIRLDGVKPLPVSGLTLDEAAEALVRSMQDDDIFVVNRVDIALQKYAPIVVAGDVQFPQRVEFTPGMTVSSAIGTAGGFRAGALSRLDAARLWAELTGQMNTYGLAVLKQSLIVNRTEAALAEADELTIKPSTLSWLPAPVFARFAELRLAQHEILKLIWSA